MDKKELERIVERALDDPRIVTYLKIHRRKLICEMKLGRLEDFDEYPIDLNMI